MSTEGTVESIALLVAEWELWQRRLGVAQRNLDKVAIDRCELEARYVAEDVMALLRMILNVG